MLQLNPRMNGRGPSATLSLNERSRELQEQGREIYRLGFGQSPFPVPEPVVEELRAHAHRKEYLPVRGLPALRQAVAVFHQTVDELDIAAENVLIGPGSKELLFLLQLSLQCELVVPAPCWVSYPAQAQILGREVRLLATTFESCWRLPAALLAEECRRDPARPRLLILNSPGNPDGGVYSEAELESLAQVAREFNLVVLSDEIYGRLTFTGRHRSPARYYPEGTIISAGLSKWCGAGGWRLGTLAFPEPLRGLADAVAAAASETYTTASAPIQYAAARAYRGGPEIEDYLGQCRRILRAVGLWSAQALREAGLQVHDPEGGFYLFAEFSPLRAGLEQRGLCSDSDLCAELLEEAGVALLPGSAFGMDPRRLTARIAYVDFEGAGALKASRSLSAEPGPDPEWCEAYCAATVRGIQRLIQWLPD